MASQYVTDVTGLTNTLAKELARLENLHRQNPDTGAGIGSTNTYLAQYTNRIFGSPFQLIDSVDQRFDSVNTHVGAEFMRNFTLNSPILHIKPGMTKYTGAQKSSALAKTLRELYTNNSNRSNASIALQNLAESTIFRSGGKLQKRMFGFQDTYYQYMSYVNYMCRSLAAFLNLNIKLEDTTTVRSRRYPNGCFSNDNPSKLTPFSSMNWGNYRFLSSETMMSPADELAAIAKSSAAGSLVQKAAKWLGKQYKSAKSSLSSFVDAAKNSSADTMTKAIISSLYAEESDDEIVNEIQNKFEGSATSELSDLQKEFANDVSISDDESANINDIIVDKVNSVMFMVEPVTFEENLTNTTEPSVIESTLASADSEIGKEIAFITNSNVEFGVIDGLTDVLGSSLDAVSESLAGIVESVSGGFLSNLLHGAIRSVKGQTMIYPDIYKGSNSEMDYTYTVNLVAPYGDDYNYYMEILVPLAHLICLASPKMVSANAIGAPFIVQSWIPGMTTCQLGMITQMHISKNPNSARHVSVHGFPLEVKVTFTIHELYNSLSISPANDPSSFLFNETLNDYMANLGGLAPSADTYNQQRSNAFGQLEEYLSSGEYAQDELQNMVSGIESFINPFVASGQ